MSNYHANGYDICTMGTVIADPWVMADVYALTCPDTGAYRYIGMSTVSAASRFRHHLGSDALGPVRDWVASLRASGKLPQLRVIATELTRQEAASLERRLILDTKGLLNRPAGPKRSKRERVQYDPNVMGCPNMLKWWKSKTNLPVL